MSSMDSLTEAVDFFTKHAGFSYNPATETSEQGARRNGWRLAEAEAWARREGVTYDWQQDWDHVAEFDCYEDGGPESCEAVTAYRNGEIVASLGCVEVLVFHVLLGQDREVRVATRGGGADDTDGDYRRVVEAELALEAMAEVTFR